MYYFAGFIWLINTHDELGYFDLNLLNKVRETSIRYPALMYIYSMRERSLNKDYESVVNVIDQAGGNIPYKDRKIIKNLLRAAGASNKGALEKSMRQFEWDDEGNRVYMDESRLEESLLGKFRDEGLKYFQKKMVKELRNP
ncbi:MAG TPA: hypothetical protein GX497_01520 [Bacillus bacterium]|nr:hypothetical protein [Bacillus sp. (in: firmicutes)]